ncbi:MAG: ribbon-helix-helix domain-containing protein [Microcoleaceae cyanobacterium]
MTSKKKPGRPKTNKTKILVSLDPIALERLDQKAQMLGKNRSELLNDMSMGNILDSSSVALLGELSSSLLVKLMNDCENIVIV